MPKWANIFNRKWCVVFTAAAAKAAVVDEGMSDWGIERINGDENEEKNKTKNKSEKTRRKADAKTLTDFF